ncbi:twin-arginine translocase subunit TatC [Echinimonas agarilytica]|uniref:Sec-independent protein translocase protein TatC n=1 Tax=Echinimonas agarilytica TaxID=1215918 RepID=A0AA41W3X4_9GAMM|nr:twin-arginine translocase subunit TatC [Echinimonas agarilytica]MCM2678239.1 twin-arginine translocase subunit TatC [Echinimonas agarilytica]
MTDQGVPLISHLIELRSRILRAVVAILVMFLCLFYFANDLYHWLATPLLAQLPQNSSMIATNVAAPFFTPFKLTLVVSMAAAMPVILHQIWGFISPGLYRHERRLAVPLLVTSVLLFYGGVAFAYYVVFPIAFAFFTSVAPEGVEIATDISSYLDFVLKILFAFGIAFEIPIAVILMCVSGVTTPQKLRQKRPYVIVSVFVVGMLLTPPDIISQTLLALPMWLLFEVGVLMASLYSKSKKDEESEDEAN